MRIIRKEITVGDIVFKIGPRINASGRIQNGKEAVELLIEKDFSAALEKSQPKSTNTNETRKDLDKTMTEEANQIVDHLEGLADRRSIVIYNEAWHKGVIGIVASRLTEIYYRPAVVLTRTDNLATGSAVPYQVSMSTKLSNIVVTCWKTLEDTLMLQDYP